MKTGPSKQVFLSWIMAVLVLGSLFVSVADVAAQVLKGSVEEENLRLTPGKGAGAAGEHGSTSLRIQRSPLSGSLVEPSAFLQPQSPAAAPLGGMVDIGDFSKLPRNFDLGAERQSREMVLAWERWHHQLSQAIYERWGRIANRKGRATISVTITRYRHIIPRVLQSSGNPEFDSGVVEAIMSLDGNPGLSFPSKSQRQQVSFEADYIAGSTVQSGYSWVKNDYERVRENH